MLARIDELTGTLRRSLAALKEILGETLNRVVEIQEDKIRNFWSFLTARNPEEAVSFAGEFLQREVADYLRPREALARSLAADLGKELGPMTITNGAFLVNFNHFQEFFDACKHLFRNAVVQAFEAPAERTRVGKDPAGALRITFGLVKSDDASFLEFSFQDDGAGVDPAVIRARLRALNYLEEVLAKNDRQIIYHVFDPFFSTVDGTSVLSGRGIGLYEIRREVEKLYRFPRARVEARPGYRVHVPPSTPAARRGTGVRAVVHPLGGRVCRYRL